MGTVLQFKHRHTPTAYRPGDAIVAGDTTTPEIRERIARIRDTLRRIDELMAQLRATSPTASVCVLTIGGNSHV